MSLAKIVVIFLILILPSMYIWEKINKLRSLQHDAGKHKIKREEWADFIKTNLNIIGAYGAVMENAPNLSAGQMSLLLPESKLPYPKEIIRTALITMKTLLSEDWFRVRFADNPDYFGVPNEKAQTILMTDLKFLDYGLTFLEHFVSEQEMEIGKQYSDFSDKLKRIPENKKLEFFEKNFDVFSQYMDVVHRCMTEKKKNSRI